MHGVPPGGKIQLLHMAEEEDDDKWKEQEVDLRNTATELFALFWDILIKQTKQFSPLASQMSSPSLFLQLLISPNISLAVWG